MRTYTAGMWIYGRIVDRYATDGYGPVYGTLDIIDLAAKSGVSGLDLNFPFPESSLSTAEVHSALSERDLTAVSVTPIIYGQRFRRGGFTNPDPAVRREAIDLAHASVDAARELGARYVKFWPGQDGYDYPFQCEYLELRRLAIEGIRDVARSFPDTTFAIEYKLKEPRARLFWSGAPATLLAIEQMSVGNVGVVLDFGHSLFAKENPAEMLHLVHAAGRLVDIELDDNYREWDDDLTAGSINLVETLEFLHVVRTIGWDGPLKLDLFPYREDAVEAVQESITTLRRLEECCDRLDLGALRLAQRAQDAMAAQRIVRAALLG
jgi:xylose isomerase